MTEVPPPQGKKQELRKDTRFRIDDASPLVYKEGLLASFGIGRSNEARAAVNLSEGGLLIRAEERLKAGTKVTVRLTIEKFNDVIEAKGIVRWCVQRAGGEAEFYAGIRFTQIPAPAISKISALRGYFTSPEYRSRRSARRRDVLGLGLL
ncbi:MAG TPA: PilZ domain-containing protein [Planctomycetota bacterium]|nr:PilZ domain-containing protein [Planctomycetota bacterium]